MTKQDVFLKVWSMDDVNRNAAQSEWMYHNRALEAGVPVSAPVFLELIPSTCTRRGVEYWVMALDFIEKIP